MGEALGNYYLARMIASQDAQMKAMRAEAEERQAEVRKRQEELEKRRQAQDQ